MKDSRLLARTTSTLPVSARTSFRLLATGSPTGTVDDGSDAGGLLGQRHQGLLEALLRRLHQPGTHLTCPGHAAGHAGVDLGQQPVRATSSTSIPVGAPRKPSTGIAIAGFSARVIWYIRSVVASASGTVPPTKRTIAGAAAIEKPPTP